MAIALEKAKDDRERITAGLPSLDSSRRRDITDRHLKRIYQQSLQAEYRGNEEKARHPLDGDRPMTVKEAQMGISLTSGQIIKRLLKLNANLWFEIAKADSTKLGVYLRRSDGAREHIGTLEAGINTEFSVISDGETPTIQQGGWRRIVMRLIRAGLIGEAAAFRLFGPPSKDSENWARFVA